MKTPGEGDRVRPPGETADLGRELSALAFRFAEEAAGCVEMQALSDRFQQAILPVGMSASASGMISGPKRVNDEVFHFVNWPKDWLALYEAEGFIHKDPVPRWAVVSGAPIAWTELLETLAADDPGHEVYRRVRAWGFYEGLVTPVRGFDGSLGLVSVGGGRRKLALHERLFLQSVSVTALHRAEAISSTGFKPAALAAINLQDREYLNWDRTAQPMLAVDATGLIHHLNRAAEQLLLSGGSLRAVSGRLTVGDAATTEHLLALVLQAGAADVDRKKNRSLSYCGANGRIAGTLTVSPLRGRGLSGSSTGPVAALHVSLRDAEVNAQEARIRERFSLTAAEWRVAAALYQGQSPQGLAATLGISVNTVRVQMSRVFAKLGVHRQTELVAAVRAALLSSDG